MNVFAISDLHLPGGRSKPMDIFGVRWENHFEQIQADWNHHVQPNDLVLIPGDISWAMHLLEARDDLASIGMLPGRKVISRGNHDYWWSSIGRVREALPSGMYAIQNDAIQFENIVICGSRGWLCPSHTQTSENDAKIYARELIRLKMSLEKAQAKCAHIQNPWLIAMLHFPPFPPFIDHLLETEVTRLLSQYAVHDVLYGHLHGPGLQYSFSGEVNGVRYHPVSCDGLGFALYKLHRG